MIVRLRKILWKALLIVLFLLSSTTSLTAQNKPYCLDDNQVKEIAYQLKSRDLLLKDTVLYRRKISNMSLMLDNKDSIINNQVGIMINKEVYISALEEDVQNLELNNTEIRNNNKKLKFKLKLSSYSIPIAVGGGFLLGVLILK